MKFLLDTCVISEIIKPRPNPVVEHWIDKYDEKAFYLSVLTLGEINHGILLLGDSTKASRLRDWFENDLPERFAGRFIHVDKAIALEWSRQKAACKKSGRPRPEVDLLLAATAIVNGLTIATRNTADFDSLEVPVFNPWEYE